MFVPLMVIDNTQTLVWVMAWCRPAQTINWTNDESTLWRHVASLSHNEWTEYDT